jgi:glycosyltransferase involved in cell wall biosynthesis
MFKIIVAGGPCEPYIHKCITSILEQDEQDFEILVALDPHDNARDVVDSFMSDRIFGFVNREPRGSAWNMFIASTLRDIDDEDIIVTVDADDWLTDSKSLFHVKQVYDKHPETLVTHGSWVSSPSGFLGKDCQQPYTREEFRDIRHAQWKASHLRTMKYKVFKRIAVADFKDDNGKWFKGATDNSLMLPALEMAGYDRVKFIPEPIYTYNRSGPRVDSGDREHALKTIRGRKPYELLGSDPHM